MTGYTDPANTQFLMEEDDILAQFTNDFVAPFQRGTPSGARHIPGDPAAHLADEVIW